MVGTACAHYSGQVHWGAASAALAGALLLQIGANLANDVFDFQKGADTGDRVGPTRVVQAGLLSARQVTVGMVISFALAVLAGIYLTAVAGVWVIVIGLVSIASAVAYTGGPYPLGYHGLGDVFVVAFFGFVAVVGSAWVQLGWVPELAWVAAVPPGALATAVLVVNNIRDRASDARIGKRTLAVVLGRKAAYAEYVLLLVVAYGAPAALWRAWSAHPLVLLPWATLPLAAGVARRVATDEGRQLNDSLVATARLLLIFGVLFCVGIAQGPHNP
jgi:1,4-dihydroxy-2-naphthoate octaprenyltransferase